MRVRRVALLASLGALALVAVPTAQAAPAPVWSVSSLASPTVFAAGEESGLDIYEVFVVNSGVAPTDRSPITITDTLPAGIGVKSLGLSTTKRGDFPDGPTIADRACETETVAEVSTVTCEITEAIATPSGPFEPALLHPSEAMRLEIHLTVPSSATGQLVNLVEVEGGGANALSVESHNRAGDEGEEAEAGFQEFRVDATDLEGLPSTGADSHPYQYTSTFAVNTALAPPGAPVPFVPARGDLKDIDVKLPPGLLGNPTAIGRCPLAVFNASPAGQCPADSVVGIASVRQLEGAGQLTTVPLYNLVPPKGMPAQLGFQPAVGLPAYIDTRLRSEGDYGVTASLRNTIQAKRVTAASVTFWGTPAATSHDRLRGRCLNQIGGGSSLSLGDCPAEIPAKPFMRMPSSCESELRTTMSFNTWAEPGAFLEALFTEPAPTGCEAPPFEPTIDAEPTTNVADAPSGLHFDLHLPQKENEDPEGLGEADLRDATVTLPPGLLVNPSSADGLDGCSPAEIGLTTPVGQTNTSFSADPPNCPDASKVGDVEVHTPLVDHPLPGSVYLANPQENPFNSLIAIYIVVDDPQAGVVVKLAGKVTPDPVTGQLTTTVDGSPQTPFEDFEFDFFKGARAPLRTPATCGTHTATTSLKPWTAPAFGPNATPSSSFEITQAPGGGSCPTSAGAQPNSPSLEAGTQSPAAGAYSPFSLRLARADGSQEINGLDLTLPPGLTGRLAGLSYCSDGALAAAASKSGKAEQGSSSCPGTSELGTVTVAAGAGPTPYHASGKAYLAGPYKGAPISMAVITPAVAGPFDLGTVVVRAALQLDPETARIKAVSDPIPSILQGIPLDVRSIDLRVDRPDFTLNPTSCEPFAFSGQALTVLGQSSALAQRFQVGNCAGLAFKPKLDLRLKGGTKRTDHPQLTATLKMPPKGANIAEASVALPRSVFLDQANIRTICTRVQFAVNACPKGSVYGYAKAWTPLLDQPLEGPVYLRSSDNLLPDLVADLNGQIHVVLHGRTDSIKGGIRNTFEGVPDAPASKFTLTLKGGKRGLLVNSRNICKGENRATAIFTAQSGKVSDLRPPLKAKCGGKGKKRGHKR
jgi:hypothetical protein